ncbi:response regulator transcription factor [Aggregatilinea lenta]|uniref:response regulator transcription factor n=1 Tax=Aggregatilinea lenta TaxID=913108 RepID=UPI000E5C5162|nr:response regulator transcription factor [Aggregatilinea lenta]
MEKHRVLLLSDHPLLSEGLANVLGKMEDLVLIGPRSASSFALSDLDVCVPDVVLFAEQDTDNIAANTVLFQILQHVPDLPVIQVGLSGDNTVRVYTSHTLPALSADLIETIRKFPLQCSDETAEDNSDFEE